MDQVAKIVDAEGANKLKKLAMTIRKL